MAFLCKCLSICVWMGFERLRILIKKIVNWKCLKQISSSQIGPASLLDRTNHHFHLFVFHLCPNINLCLWMNWMFALADCWPDRKQAIFTCSLLFQLLLTLIMAMAMIIRRLRWLWRVMSSLAPVTHTHALLFISTFIIINTIIIIIDILVNIIPMDNDDHCIAMCPLGHYSNKLYGFCFQFAVFVIITGFVSSLILIFFLQHHQQHHRSKTTKKNFRQNQKKKYLREDTSE